MTKAIVYLHWASPYTAARYFQLFHFQYVKWCKIINMYILGHFWPMLPFYTPRKHQKTKGFLVFSGGIKWEHWPEMG